MKSPKKNLAEVRARQRAFTIRTLTDAYVRIRSLNLRAGVHTGDSWLSQISTCLNMLGAPTPKPLNLHHVTGEKIQVP